MRSLLTHRAIHCGVHRGVHRSNGRIGCAEIFQLKPAFTAILAPAFGQGHNPSKKRRAAGCKKLNKR